MIRHIGFAGLLLASAAGLAACDDGYGYGRDPAVGYGPAYDGYHDGYAGAYGDPAFDYRYPGYYGWYGGFYYPGSGIYVYDRYRRPFRWNGDQRRYWSGQHRAFATGRGQGSRGGANWGGFTRGAATGTSRLAGQAFRGGAARPGGGHGGHAGGHHHR